MKDFIFIVGPSGVGKSTLAKNLFKHYKSTYIEQWMIPEFESRDGVEEMTGELEERTCWEAMVSLLMCFNGLGYKNVVASDLDDLRTRDIPIVFKGYTYISIKLICSDLDQLQSQMKNRQNGGLIDFELQRKMNERNIDRKPLVNEYEIDIARITPDMVMKKAINLIDNTECLFDYEYEMMPKELFYSWVFSNGLR